MNKNNKLHYAWVIMMACISMKIGEGSINCMLTNFVTPIVKELGCEVSQLTLAMSIDAIGMACFYMIAAKLITTKRVGIVMGIASVLQVIGLGLMSTYRSVYPFYFSGALIGSAAVFTGFVATPVLISMWFKKKAGTVLGTVVAVSNASSVIMNLLSARFIDAYGWRNAYLILAAIACVFMVPATFGFLKSPAEAGVEPYGAEEGDAPVGAISSSGAGTWGLTRKEAFRKAAFWIAWASCMCISLGSGCPGYLANFATMELNQSIYFGSVTSVCMSLGCVACSVIIGRINDRYGVRWGFVWGVAFSALGFATEMISIANPNLAIPGALLIGLGGSMYAVQCPLLAKSVLGEKHYASIWSIMMIALSGIGGGLYFTWGKFYDNTGTYKGAFLLAIGLYVLSLILGFLAVSLSEKYKPKKNGTAAAV